MKGQRGGNAGTTSRSSDNVALKPRIEENVPISPDLMANRETIETVFANCGDLAVLDWRYGPGLAHAAFSVYFTTLVQDKTHNYMKESLQDLVSHEVGPADTIKPEDVVSFFGRKGVSAQSATVIEDFGVAVRDILKGSIVIFFNEWERALSYDALSVEMRQVSESVIEPVVQGPRLSTVEELDKNIGMLRCLLRSPKFKLETIEAGKEVRRDVAFGYLDGAVNPETLAEFRQRLADIGEEEILETSYLEEWIGEGKLSPFPQVRYTERPDVSVAALLDGKIVVMVSGTPTMMICPGLFFEYFAASEDYYHRPLFSSMIRLLRVGAFIMALMLPSSYIALTTFHSELIPTVLLLAILDTREGIPFPAFVEAFLMEFFFELLREAGIRMPRPIGSAVSIVGALVIGQAAIQAKIASPVMVIVVALTGIASFALPQYNMAVAVRLLRFPLMLLAASIGGLGIMIGLLLMLLHLTCLRSLGQPYLSSMAPLEIKRLRDIFIIVPRKMLTRSPRNRHRHMQTAGRSKLK